MKNTVELQIYFSTFSYISYSYIISKRIGKKFSLSIDHHAFPDYISAINHKTICDNKYALVMTPAL